MTSTQCLKGLCGLGIALFAVFAMTAIVILRPANSAEMRMMLMVAIVVATIMTAGIGNLFWEEKGETKLLDFGLALTAIALSIANIALCLALVQNNTATTIFRTNNVPQAKPGHALASAGFIFKLI